MAISAVSSPLHSQTGDTVGFTRWIFPGSEAESYLRHMQVLGLVQPHPWGVRAFAGAEIRQLRPPRAGHPWAETVRIKEWRSGDLRLEAAPIHLSTTYNSEFPYGMNDGAVWAGRGLTASAAGGMAVAWGPLELTLAPVVFWAQNRRFPLRATGDSLLPFADPLFPTDVDRPQRFGDRPYARLDPGESGVRADLFGVAMGLANVHQTWGPMTDFPLVLGTNAAGFPHVFVGSSAPFGVAIGRLHGRIIYGSLSQSAYGPVTEGNGRRFVGAMVISFEPRWFPNLELGATRLYQVAWPEQGEPSREYFLHLFESFLKHRTGKVFLPWRGARTNSTDNQLASVFARWVMPRDGFELYGEYGREDHNTDARDLTLEPDHGAAYGIGFRKAWSSHNVITAVRAELVALHTSHLARHRAQEAWYRHTFTEQGHTHHGQLLATGIAVGSGGGTSVVLERFANEGLTRVVWSRYTVRDRVAVVQSTDVQHILRLERRVRVSRRFGVRAGIDGVLELNGASGRDRGNVRLELGTIWRP